MTCVRRMVGAILAAALASAVASAQTLNVGLGAPATGIDPHYHNLAPNIALSAQIFDELVERDANARLIPGLALSGKLVALDTWEFKLRDAKFQDGTPFTADDAAGEKVLTQAERMAFDDVAIIPIHSQKNIWATNARLTFMPSIGETRRLIDIKPAK